MKIQNRMRPRHFFALSACMLAVICLSAVTAFTASYSDTNSHWGESVIDKWSAYDVLHGDGDGTFAPDRDMRVAELATVLVNAYGYTETGSVSVSPSIPSWAVDNVRKAVAAGVIAADETGLSLTRELSAKILANAMGVAPLAGTTTFADDDAISAAYKPYVNALGRLGVFQGDPTENFMPKKGFTRAEVMQVLENSIADIVHAGKPATADKSLLVNTAGVELTAGTVHGDLIIGQGVGNGSVTLTDVKIEGRLIVYGGAQAIYIRGNSVVPTVVLQKTFGEPARIVVEGAARVDAASVIASSKAIVEGNVAKVEVVPQTAVTAAGDIAPVSPTRSTAVEIANGTVAELSVAVGNVAVTVDDNATVAKLAITGANTEISVASGATVTAVEVAARDVSIEGSGKVANVTVTAESAGGVTITVPGAQIKNESTAAVSIGADKTIAAGASGSVPSAVVSGGGSSSGSSSPGGGPSAAEMNALARDIERAEAIRAVKDLQRTYVQYNQYGLWNEAAGLFTDNADFIVMGFTGTGLTTEWSRENGTSVTGKTNIGAYLKTDGGNSDSLGAGALNTRLIDEPLVNLSVDGQSAKARWMSFSFVGNGAGQANILGGIFENEYAIEGGIWKISKSCYYPYFQGPYSSSWTKVNDRLPLVPYHFTLEESGIPIPEPEGTAPMTYQTLAQLMDRVDKLNAEQDVRNLQHMYGYYVNRKMWDDVADLFDDEWAIQINDDAGAETYGSAGGDTVLSVMEGNFGPTAATGGKGLQDGQLNDRLLWDTLVEVVSDNEAYTRGIELGMLAVAQGDGNGEGSWEINVYRNRFVKEDGIWKLREVRYYPIMELDYYTHSSNGWANGAGITDSAATKLPAFLSANPGTNQPVATPSGRELLGTDNLTGDIAPARSISNLSAAEVRRKLNRAVAWDGSDNINSAYTFYLDDLQWKNIAGVFAEDGNKQSPFAGYYLGRERVEFAGVFRYGVGSQTARSNIAIHYVAQPVILVSEDGRSTSSRTQLFQVSTAGGSIGAGMYPNNQTILDAHGIWRLQTLEIDEFYTRMEDPDGTGSTGGPETSWTGGWGKAKFRATNQSGSALVDPTSASYFEPNIRLTAIPFRQEHFVGGTGTALEWPYLLPMWFNYRNPVSGRVPDMYWPGSVIKEVAPQTTLGANGYQEPETGPTPEPNWDSVKARYSWTSTQWVPNPPSNPALNELNREVERLEALRAVKDLERSYAQYAQYGLWNEMAGLFSSDAKINIMDITGEGASRTYVIGESIANSPVTPNGIKNYLTAGGGGAQGLMAGALNAEFIDNPVVNLSSGGTLAKARWNALTFTGDGVGGTEIKGGIYENEYKLTALGGGPTKVWRISAVNYYPYFEGAYATGWTNIDGDKLPLVPYHFTSDETGIPIAAVPKGPAPYTTQSLADIEQRIDRLNDEDAVRNLQHAYGHYVDRKMWDDVVDLFTSESAIEVYGNAAFYGKTGVRQAMEQFMGPSSAAGTAGLSHGELNERPIFDTIVEVVSANEAYTRGIELGMLGEADKEEGAWTISVFRNRFVKEDGLWKLKEIRYFPIMRADYYQGWGSGAVLPDATTTAPAFFYNPGTHQPVNAGAAGISLWANDILTDPITGSWNNYTGSDAQRLAEAKRKLSRSAAWDATENVNAVYGYYLDDNQFLEMCSIFAEKGNKQSPFAGFYLGKDRIRQAAITTYGQQSSAPRNGISFHWLTQQVILVSEDGRSTSSKTRLFQPRTGTTVAASGLFGAVFSSGSYPNNQSVLENGIWRLWTLAIDEPYFSMAGWSDGWAKVKDQPAGGGFKSPLIEKYPPDVLLTDLGERQEHFSGGTGQVITWPGILPMWFNHRNPVSGRVPDLYWPGSVIGKAIPSSTLEANGYQEPSTGPGPEPY
ncbi:MAG: nuclear transport factor 2 family protein [Clostridiales Family XIII bacterium]|jgi:hypothetical protein|nr:nuclear transport factor 2 family protein [Clostridiales Family XIII bacterium]